MLSISQTPVQTNNPLQTLTFTTPRILQEPAKDAKLAHNSLIFLCNITCIVHITTVNELKIQFLIWSTTIVHCIQKMYFCNGKIQKSWFCGDYEFCNIQQHCFALVHQSRVLLSTPLRLKRRARWWRDSEAMPALCMRRDQHVVPMADSGWAWYDACRVFRVKPNSLVKGFGGLVEAIPLMFPRLDVRRMNQPHPPGCLHQVPIP